MKDQEISRRGVIRGAGAAAVTAAAVGATATVATGGPAGATAAGRAARGARPAAVADTVVLNGRVLPMTRRGQRAQAVAMRHGRIVAVGTNREIRRLAGRRTEEVDAAGGTVMPGVNDGHLHFNQFGLEAGLFGFDPPRPAVINVGRPTAAEIAQAVGAAASAATAPDSWIRGGGWNGNILDRLPTRDVLDPVSGAHPVVLDDFSHHAVAVNSEALRRAGITRDTVPPAGGVIEKDASGEPTGILREGAAGLVARVVPAFTRAEISEAMDFAVTVAHSLGITSVTDPGVSLPLVRLYAAKVRQGQLPLRMNLMLAAGQSRGSLREILDGFSPVRGVDERRLRVAEVKIFGDGVPTEAQTAWLHEPYVDGSNGRLNVKGDTIREQVRMLRSMIELATKRGFQVGTHATGDATIDAVVSSYVRTRTDELRNYVIHGDLASRTTLKRMARHDIGVSFNPTIKYLLGRTLDSTLGPTRVNYQWPFRSALDLGVKASSASDAPVVSPNWLIGVAGAVTRRGMYGGVAGKKQAITVEEALTSYTRTPAWQDHAERWKGRLATGYAADVAVLDGDILKRDPRDIPELTVAATLMNGKVVYDATGSGSSAARAASVALAGYRHDAAVDCLQAGACCCANSERFLAQQQR